MNKSYRFSSIFGVHWFSSLFLPSLKTNEFRILQYYIEDALLVSMLYMNMNGIMFIREEIEDESEVFKDFSHFVIALQLCTANIEFISYMCKNFLILISLSDSKRTRHVERSSLMGLTVQLFYFSFFFVRRKIS